MPKSVTFTPSGNSLSARRFATSTPKPSSWRKILPMPATRMHWLISVSPSVLCRKLHAADFYIADDVRQIFSQHITKGYERDHAQERWLITLVIAVARHCFSLLP